MQMWHLGQLNLNCLVYGMQVYVVRACLNLINTILINIISRGHMTTEVTTATVIQIWWSLYSGCLRASTCGM